VGRQERGDGTLGKGEGERVGESDRRVEEQHANALACILGFPDPTLGTLDLYPVWLRWHKRNSTHTI
jgi:hypothetical protein